jgi:hypothetical protein
MGPMVVEWFKKRRAEEESAAAYVRKEQAKKLEIATALLKGDSNDLNRITETRLRVIRALYGRVRSVSESPDRATDVLPARPGLSADDEPKIRVPPTG